MTAALPAAAFDHIGINGALHQIGYLAQLTGLFLKDADELLADDLALFFRFGHTRQLVQEAIGGVHPNEVDVVVFREHLLHHVALILAQQAVIHKNAGELAAHRLGHHDGGHGGIHAAGQGAQHLAGTDLLPDFFNGVIHKGGHFPIALAATHPEQEIFQHFVAVLGMVDLGMELHRIQASSGILHGCAGAAFGMSGDAKSIGKTGNIVGVAHPAALFLRHSLEEQAVGLYLYLGFAVFARGGPHLSVQHPGHELRTVADAQYGHTQRQDSRIIPGRIVGVHAVGSAGKDDALIPGGADIFQGVRQDLTTE